MKTGAECLKIIFLKKKKHALHLINEVLLLMHIITVIFEIRLSVVFILT